MLSFAPRYPLRVRGIHHAFAGLWQSSANEHWSGGGRDSHQISQASERLVLWVECANKVGHIGLRPHKKRLGLGKAMVLTYHAVSIPRGAPMGLNTIRNDDPHSPLLNHLNNHYMYALSTSGLNFIVSSCFGLMKLTPSLKLSCPLSRSCPHQPILPTDPAETILEHIFHCYPLNFSY